MGLCGALITIAPPSWQPYRSPDYDQFWAVAQDLDIPLSFHVATQRGDPRVGPDAFRLNVKDVPPSMFVNSDFQVRQTLAELIFSGVFERFPRLRVGSIEHELGWIPFFLQRLDYTYTDRPAAGRTGGGSTIRTPCRAASSRRNVFASFQEDPHGMRLRDVCGVETLMWGSDYPHTESTFPRSREILSEILAEVTPAEAVQIASTNCADLYGFDVPKDAPPASP